MSDSFLPEEDSIFLRGLRFDLVVGCDAWGRKDKAQPVIISLEAAPGESFEAAASGDDVSKTLDYGKLFKRISSALSSTESFDSASQVALTVANCLQDIQWIKIKIILPKASLRAGNITYSLAGRDCESASTGDTLFKVTETFLIDNLTCPCIIGVNPHERLDRQIVNLGLKFEVESISEQSTPRTRVDEIKNIVSASIILGCLPLTTFQDMAKKVVERVEGSDYRTIEALTTAIAQMVTVDMGHQAVTVNAEKPNAFASIEAAGVRIHRTKSFFQNKDFWKIPGGY